MKVRKEFFIMKKNNEKSSFAKTFIAFSLVSAIVAGSLISVTAAISGSLGDSTVSTKDEAAAKLSDINSPALHVVVLDNNGKQQTVLFPKGTVAELLEMTGTTVGENQIAIPAMNTVIDSDTVVYVRNAKPVKVTIDGETKLMVLSYGTVAESLRLAGIPLSDEDILSVKRDAKIEKLDAFTLRRVTYKNETVTEKVPFEKVTENSDKVELGETKVKTEGKDGEKQVTKKVKYVGGKKKSETVVSEKVTKKPVNEVTLIGTKGVATTGVAGTFTDSNGVTVAYKEMFTGSGTAYTAPAGASTATGAPAHHGGVAIDPTIIPYGSKLYVESVDGSIVYGYCTAIDTGGFCDDGSGIIDVFYDTYDECVNWGRRDVNVYVIE